MPKKKKARKETPPKIKSAARGIRRGRPFVFYAAIISLYFTD